MIVIQIMIYLGIFTGMVAFAVRKGAVNELYFYPKLVQERAFEIGLIDREVLEKKRKIFMSSFVLVMAISLIVIIGLWNRVDDFQTAYWQALLFLEVMNWFDGIVIDRLWVGHSKFWILPGTEDLPFVQTWKQVLKKRTILTFVWLFGAAIVAGFVILIF